MERNRQTIEKLYEAFARLDADAMAQCYAQDADFEDEVFALHGKHEVMGMWRMLVQGVQAQGREEWRLSWRNARAAGRQGQAHWDAHYRFGATGRIVDNSVDALFEFDGDGRIRRHRDRFDFWRWSRQALGAPGVLLGWTPMLRRRVQQRARGNLLRFMDAAVP